MSEQRAPRPRLPMTPLPQFAPTGVKTAPEEKPVTTLGNKVPKLPTIVLPEEVAAAATIAPTVPVAPAGAQGDLPAAQVMQLAAPVGQGATHGVPQTVLTAALPQVPMDTNQRPPDEALVETRLETPRSPNEGKPVFPMALELSKQAEIAQPQSEEAVSYVKTTFELPDYVYTQLHIVAFGRGVSKRAIVLEALSKLRDEDGQPVFNVAPADVSGERRRTFVR
jgi:hypothetical protein